MKHWAMLWSETTSPGFVPLFEKTFGLNGKGFGRCGRSSYQQVAVFLVTWRTGRGPDHSVRLKAVIHESFTTD
jgi:hypothetical protein